MMPFSSIFPSDNRLIESKTKQLKDKDKGNIVKKMEKIEFLRTAKTHNMDLYKLKLVKY